MFLFEWPTLIPYCLSALISLSVCFYTLRFRRVPEANAFAFLALFESIWTVGYIFQLLDSTLAGKLFWNNVQFLGAVAAPVAFFWFGVNYAGFTFTRRVLVKRGIWIASAALLALIWTDGWHHLFRVMPHLQSGAPFSRLVFIDGPLFWLYPLIGYAQLTAGTYYLVRNFIAAPPIYRRQIATVMAGILIPWVVTLLTWLRLVAWQLHDVTPLSFAVSNLLVTWALFHYRLFDLVPVAYHLLINQMQDGVIVLDAMHRILDLNPAARRILNLSAQPSAGTALGDLEPRFASYLNPQAGGQTVDLVLPVEGQERSFDVLQTPLQDVHRGITGSLIVLRDMSERRAFEIRLQEMAVTDPLTGIYNRRQFFELAEAALAEAHQQGCPLSVIIMDIDHFKRVNDTYGHLAGDLVLSETVNRCRHKLRPQDVFARYGGEEFILLLPDTTLYEALTIGERLRTAIYDQPFSHINHQIAITISAGAAAINGDPRLTFDDLVDRADQALLKAKKSGRNRVLA